MPRPRKKRDPNHMTVMQKAVFDYIKQFVIERGYSPSIRDIGKAVKLKSTSSVFKYLNDLEEMGVIKKDPIHTRSIVITTPEFQSNRGAIRIPVIKTSNLEAPLLSKENVTEYYPVSSDMLSGKEGFIVVMKDDSMKEYGILKEDKLIVQRQDTCANGDTVAALVNDDVVIKRFAGKKGNNVTPSCQIIGKVIGFVRMDIK